MLCFSRSRSARDIYYAQKSALSTIQRERERERESLRERERETTERVKDFTLCFLRVVRIVCVVLKGLLSLKFVKGKKDTNFSALFRI